MRSTELELRADWTPAQRAITRALWLLVQVPKANGLKDAERLLREACEEIEAQPQSELARYPVEHGRVCEAARILLSFIVERTLLLGDDWRTS